MTTIWERTATALAGLALSQAANTYIVETGDELPDTFLVYSLVSSPAEQHADNAETLRSYRVQVSAYSRAGLIGLPDIDAAMVAAGFKASDRRELPYNPDTRHFGLALDYIYFEGV